MKKIFIALFATILSFNVLAVKINAESVNPTLLYEGNQLNDRWSKINWVDIIDTDSIPEHVKDLTIDEDLTSQNILISLTNNTDKDINVTGMVYLANGTSCGYTKTNINIKAKTKVADYFMDKSQGQKCLKLIEGRLNNRFGHLNLIDLGYKFDTNKYQQFTTGLFLYPVRLSVVYSSKGSLAKQNKTFYLIFATL
jgi:hypothetical protein